MKIPCNQHTGIIGISGQEIHITDIIIGFIKPNKGDLIIGDDNIFNSEELNRKWFNSTYLISQNELIFNGSFQKI